MEKVAIQMTPAEYRRFLVFKETDKIIKQNHYSRRNNKKSVMEKVILEYEPANALMSSFLNTAILAGFRIVTPSKTLTPFEKSLEDIKCGRVTRIKNVSNLLEECMQ